MLRWTVLSNSGLIWFLLIHHEIRRLLLVYICPQRNRITLDNLITKARSLEISEVQASGIDRTVASEFINSQSNLYFNNTWNFNSRSTDVATVAYSGHIPPAHVQQKDGNATIVGNFIKVCQSKPTSSSKPEIIQMPKRDTANHEPR